MKNQSRKPGAARQRGIGTLTVSLTLLLALSVVAFYLNRNLVFEQRTANSYVQASKAQEIAEAGLEWATGMLNSPYDIDAACVAQATSDRSFRKRYVQTRWGLTGTPPSPFLSNTDVIPTTITYPGCRHDGQAWVCSCPTPDASAERVAALGSSDTPKFTVAFETVAGDAEAVRVTSWGCTAQTEVCRSGSTAGADGSARVTAILKLKPVLRAAPSSALTCGSSCSVGGSYNIVNNDVGSNGILVNAGTTISTGNGVSLETLPGQPGGNALVGADDSLRALSSTDPTCSNSNMFKAYFGSTMDEYRSAAKVLSCSSASDCRSKLQTEYDKGVRAFYFESDVQLSGNGTFGSPSDPVTLVTPNGLRINGTYDIYGMIFSNSADYNDLGTGAANIHGALVSCASYNNNGNGTLTYSAEVLANLRRSTGVLVRVPGSWRDFTLNADAKP